MKITSTTEHPVRVDSDWLAVGVLDGQESVPDTLADHPIREVVARLLASQELGTGLGETTPVHTAGDGGPSSVLLYGLGHASSFGPGAAFSAGVAVGKRLGAKPRRRVVAVPPSSTATIHPGVLSAYVEGIIVGTRSAALRKAEATRHAFDELVLAIPEASDDVGSRFDAAAVIARAATVGEAVNLARDLVNTPPSEKPPRVLAARAREVLDSPNTTVDVWDADRIRAERFGGLLAVSAGSSEPPAFVTIRYRGAGGDRAEYALVGKGVTFDSGGLSLKPSASMEDMKADMSGAAIVLATIQAAARLKLPVDLDGYLVLTENMTGGAAMKLGDVLTIRNGKTVEVLNTDAEGRLVLADALAYAVEQQPARVIDLATLTGACMVALGPKLAGLFSNDEPLSDAFEAACRRTGERVWRMPLEEDYDDLLKSCVADMKNVGGKWGGAITAAKFLQRFVAETPWLHLDIAGPSWADSDSSTRDAGGTGCFVRTLLALISPDED